MRTTIQMLSAVLFSIGLSASAAHAAPGDAVSGADAASDEDQRVALLTPAGTPCAGRGALCMTAGSLRTRSAVSWIAGAAGAPLTSGDASLFLRVLSEGANQRSDEEYVPWTLEVQATFQKRALAGNALFVLTDIGDPEQTADSHVVTALYQEKIGGGERASVRLVLHPQDGFRAGHTYRLRVVQIVSGKEVELASGEVGLL